jgi:hypothetical protein
VPSRHRWHSRSTSGRSHRSRGGFCASGPSAGRCSSPVGPRDRLGGGSVAPSHHAKKGRGGSSDRRVRLEHRGQLCRGAGWKQFLVGEGLMQDSLEEMNPLIGICLRHPKQLTLHFLNRVLFHRGQNEAPCVRHRRSGTGVIRTVTSACAGLPIDRAVLQIGHERPLEMRQQCHEFFLG